MVVATLGILMNPQDPMEARQVLCTCQNDPEKVVRVLEKGVEGMTGIEDENEDEEGFF